LGFHYARGVADELGIAVDRADATLRAADPRHAARVPVARERAEHGPCRIASAGV